MLKLGEDELQRPPWWTYSDTYFSFYHVRMINNFLIIDVLFCCSEGSVIVDIVPTVYRHPDAEPTFLAAFNNLNFSQLFPEEDVISLFSGLLCKFPK